MTTASLLRIGLGLSLGLCATTPASAADPVYTLTDLGTLGGAESMAFGLNDAGQVVGWANVPGCTTDNGFPCRHAFVWQDGVMTDLGMLPGDEDSVARAINDAGLIVGTSERDVIAGSGTFHGVTWTAGVISPLPDLGDGQSFAHDVNASGVVAGHARDPMVSRDRAVTWAGGAISNVGASEPHSYNRAMGLNDAGLLAGFAWNLFEPNDSILFDGTKWVTIGGIDGPFQNSELRDVNDAGLAVGLQAFPSGDWHCAVFGMGGSVDAGVLPGHELGVLHDANDAGLAVGRSYDGLDPLDSCGVLWDGSTLHDLNALLAPGSGALVWEAREINEAGDIAATALIGGKLHAVLLESADVGSWGDLGDGLAGTLGTPSLAGDGPLLGGSTATLTLTDGLPGAPAWLVLGLDRIDAPFKQGVLVPALDLLIGGIVLDGSGGFALPFAWPLGLPGSVSTYWQTWIQDAGGPAGWAASNGLQATTP